MSIRQLSFEEGEALNIRECVRLPRNNSYEELKTLAENEEVKIVKSGKSYFDVTAKPEIFDQAHEFDINELTGIDKREMQQAEVAPAFDEAQINDPMSMLYQNTSQPDEEEEEFERKTYYLRPDQVEALRIICYKEVGDVSATVRNMLDTAIAEKSAQHGIDFRAEAEKNLLTKPRKPKRRKRSAR